MRPRVLEQKELPSAFFVHLSASDRRQREDPKRLVRQPAVNRVTAVHSTAGCRESSARGHRRLPWPSQSPAASLHGSSSARLRHWYPSSAAGTDQTLPDQDSRLSMLRSTSPAEPPRAQVADECRHYAADPVHFPFELVPERTKARQMPATAQAKRLREPC